MSDKNHHAVELGKLGGKVKSLRKSIAARINGRLGGRPRERKSKNNP